MVIIVLSHFPIDISHEKSSQVNFQLSGSATVSCLARFNDVGHGDGHTEEEGVISLSLSTESFDFHHTGVIGLARSSLPQVTVRHQAGSV